jgi:putative oxidoreductase
MLGSIFIAEGFNALRDPDRLVQKAKPVTDRLAPVLQNMHPKLPTDAKTLVRINAGTQVIGGVLLATGRAPTPAALALAASLVPTTYAGHAYWTIDDPEQRRLQRVMFMKNVGLLGGLIFAALDNEGRPSLSWRAKHGTTHAVKAARRRAKIAVRTAKDKLPMGS